MVLISELQEHVNSYQRNSFMTRGILTALDNTAAVHKIEWNEDTESFCKESIIGRLRKFSTQHVVVNATTMDIILDAPKDSIVLYESHFTSPEICIDGEESLLMNTGLYSILDSYRLRYYLPHYMEYNGGLLCHACLMSMGVPYMYKNITGLTNVIASSPVQFNSIRNVLRSKRVEYMEKGKTVMIERQEFIYLMAASTGATTFIAGAFGCGAAKNNSANVAKGWLDCEMKYPGVFNQIIHPIENKNTYRVLKDILS